jgi:short-subunit dehydrogenase
MNSRPLALVTGASSGIGYELARRFLREGYDVALVAEDRDRLTEAAQRLGAEEQDAELEIIVADLSQPDGVNLVYEAVRAMGRPVDVLAANAGVGVSGRFATQTHLEAEIALINLNVTSQVHLIKLIAFDMVNQGRGDILITSSIAATMPGPYMAVYAASKAFLKSFGQAIRHELQDTGVNVTVLMPGPTDTDFFERANMEDTPAARAEKADAAEVAAAAFDALRAGSDHVIPGMKNKLQSGVARLMSEEARARTQAAQLKPQGR